MCDYQPCLINLSGDAVAAAPASVPAVGADAVIDYRENALISSLRIKCRTGTLDVGDIWIGCKEGEMPALVLERKTVRDWESSVIDGRYREQRGRLLAFSQEHGARIGYILEGRWDSSVRIGDRAIMKLVARMQLVHGIPVLWAGSVKETAALVESLQSMWEKDGSAAFKGELDAQRQVEGIKVAKKDNFDDPRMFAIRCIAQCPGVSPKSAEVILDAFGGTLKAVMNAGSEEIAEVKCGARRIGIAVATKLVRLFGAGAGSSEIDVS
jgi:ERCC4-type nuclease